MVLWFLNYGHDSGNYFETKLFLRKKDAFDAAKTLKNKVWKIVRQDENTNKTVYISH